MSSNHNTQGDTAKEFIAVELMYDDSSKQLNAILSSSPVKVEINKDALKAMLSAGGFDRFNLPDSAFDKVIENVESGQPGVIRLAGESNYSRLDIVVDQITEMVNAVVSPSDVNEQLTKELFDKKLKDSGIDPNLVAPVTLDTVFQKAQSSQLGTYPLCTKPEFTHVELVYDEGKKSLSAVLTAADEYRAVTVENLKAEIKEKDYGPITFKQLSLEDLLEHIKENKRGTFALGVRTEYTQVKFAYDPDSRKLSAILSESLTGPSPNSQFVQNILQNKYSNFKLIPGILADLESKIENNEWGKYEVGEKPEYTSIEISFDPASETLNAILKATEVEEKTSKPILLDIIKQGNFDKLKFEDNALDHIITCAKNNDRGVYVLAKKQNASISIDISKDEMQALISTEPAFGGIEIDETRLLASVQEAGIDKRCIKKEVLKQVLEEDRVSNLVFAEGKPAVNGTNSSFEALVVEVYYRDPPESRSGKIDLNDLMEFTMVDPGTPLMKRTPATEGEPGFTVKGKVIKSKGGIEVKYNKDLPGTKFSEQDEHLLVADTKGHPVILKDGVRVDQTLIVNNVSSGTGNITFDGSLMVKGDVMPGITIDVTGDVIVKGLATNATILAGNNITVHTGIVGTEPIEKSEETAYDFEPNIRAEGTIAAKYVTLSRLAAGENIEVKEYISHCFCRAKKRIMVGQAGGKGSLFGGDCHADAGISVNMLGTDSGMRTQINAGRSINIHKEIEQLTENLTTRQKESGQLDAIHKKYVTLVKSNPKDTEKVKKLKVINTTIAALNREIDKIMSQIGKLKHHVNDTRDSDIVVKKIAYPNVFITINGAGFQIRKESKGGRFSKFGSDIRWE